MLSSRSGILKACVFATGLSGIVAEYVMSTLASYLLGDAVRQWTLTMSLMLFAMGVGSRLSRWLRRDLLDAFIGVELALSLLCALSAPLIYALGAWIEPVGFWIYLTAFSIGLLIGLEIPLAARLNEVFEDLRVNLSSVMEKDYYGALLGGLLFAFVALPHLGLTYTPIVLGAVNFVVAALLFGRFRAACRWPRRLTVAFAATGLALIAIALLAEPMVLFGEQKKYRDRIVYSQQTPYQRIVMTRWKDHHWLFLDGSEQFSSYDEHRYHEPLVHPAFAIVPDARRVLVLGGGDGLAVREILQHPVETVTLVDLDPTMTELARTHPVLTALNGGSLDDPRVEVVNADAYAYLQHRPLDAEHGLFDIILIDLPDPKTVSLARLYSLGFYRLAAGHLRAGGVLVTQATSPFFARDAFVCILNTIDASGLTAVPYHNHVPTMGEWGWVLGVKPPASRAIEAEALRQRLVEARFDGLETRFLNHDAMVSMLHFGKGLLDNRDTIRVSDEQELAVFYYYRDGAWDLY